MALELFSKTALPERRTLNTLRPKCDACKLKDACRSPKMPPVGKGRKKILVVGEAPGAAEDDQGVPFVGKTGQLLRRTLAGMDVDLDRDCVTTNAVVCRPKNNELPDKAIDYCRPNLLNAIRTVQPEVILLLGGAAVKSLLSWLWREDAGGMGATRWAGWQIPCQRDGAGKPFNTWVCPTFHPSFVVREADKVRDGACAAELIWKYHLERAVRLQGRPWKTIPDYRDRVDVVLDPGRAAGIIDDLAKNGAPVAFDLETDRLKPDHPDARILTCAVSDGRTTLAFPWHGAAARAMTSLCASDVPKIGFNAKYEDRWIRKVTKKRVRNWVWDGMLAAHVIDNRRGICSLKFQSFVLLGQGDYDGALKPYMHADSGNAPNRLGDADLHQVLTYNGMDALLTYKVARKQARHLGIEL